MDEEMLFDEYGLPCYLDMQAEIGYTKHIGGLKATRELLKLCGINSDKAVINVGCGAGRSTSLIAEEYGCNVVGVDIKANMIESAQKWAISKGVADKTTFRRADAQDLPFEDNSFDILICESVNIFVPDKEKAIREYVRVIKPGGVVGLNEAVWYKPPSNQISQILMDMVGHEILAPAVWEELLKGAGLSNVYGRVYSTKIREESRNQLGFFNLADFLGVLVKSVKLLFRSSYYRNLIKQAAGASSKEFVEYVGYGLFVGWKGKISSNTVEI